MEMFNIHSTAKLLTFQGERMYGILEATPFVRKYLSDARTYRGKKTMSMIFVYLKAEGQKCPSHLEAKIIPGLGQCQYFLH